MLNNINIMGRLTADPISNVTQSGKTVVNFHIANKRRDGNANFFACKAWGGTAELISNHFSKGQRIIVSGEMNIDNFTNKDGQAMKAYIIDVRAIDFVELKDSAEYVDTTEDCPF